MYKYLALCYFFPFLSQRRLSFLKTFLVSVYFVVTVTIHAVNKVFDPPVSISPISMTNIQTIRLDKK